MNTCKICKSSGSTTPDILKQKLWVWDPAIYLCCVHFCQHDFMQCLRCYYSLAVYFNWLLSSRTNSKALPSMKSFLIVFSIHYFLWISFLLYVYHFEELKWLNLHCCHLCAYLIYPISLKLLTEQKRGLSIIVSPNVYVDEWINKWMNIQSFKKIKVDRWIRRARTFHWGFHHSALRTQWRKNVSYSHICPWS